MTPNRNRIRRWDLALRYRMIQTVAWWEGRLTTNHLMQSFGISRQQASKDINSYISDYAPKNLEYDKHLKGYVPSRRTSNRSLSLAPAPTCTCSAECDRAQHIRGWRWPMHTPKYWRCQIISAPGGAPPATQGLSRWAATGCSMCPSLRRMAKPA